MRDTWAVGDAYEWYVDRWSRQVAPAFVRWLDLPAGQRWPDVGCGTGALSSVVLALVEPAALTGVDPSEGFVAHARAQVSDPRASFDVGDAQALPMAAGSVDVVA